MVRLYFNPQAFEFADPYGSKWQLLDEARLIYVADLEVDSLGDAWDLAQNGVERKHPN